MRKCNDKVYQLAKDEALVKKLKYKRFRPFCLCLPDVMFVTRGSKNSLFSVFDFLSNLDCGQWEDFGRSKIYIFDTTLILNIIYVWKLNQPVLELDIYISCYSLFLFCFMKFAEVNFSHKRARPYCEAKTLQTMKLSFPTSNFHFEAHDIAVFM